MKNIRKNSVMENRNKGMIGMNSFVKTLVLVVVMGCLGWSLFGNGGQEYVTASNKISNYMVIKKYDLSGKEISASTISIFHEVNWGKHVIKIHFPDYSDFQYMLLEKNGEYYNAYQQDQNLGSWPQSIFSDTDIKDGNNTMELTESDLNIEIGNSEIWEDTIQDISIYNELSGFNTEVKDYITINWSDLDNFLSLDLLIVYKNQKFRRFKFDILPEFFPGELFILNQINLINPSLSATKVDLAIYMISKLVNDNSLFSIADQFGSSTIKIQKINTIIDDNFGDLSNYISSLKKSLTKNFGYDLVNIETEEITFSVPQIQFTKNKFYNLYGANTNPYIKSYLLYLYGKSRPLYASYIRDELWTHKIKYNYKDYIRSDLITKSGDIGGKLAKNSLRYLTWGVEYTPYEGFYPIASPSQKVFNKNFSQIMNWCKHPL